MLSTLLKGRARLAAALLLLVVAVLAVAVVALGGQADVVVYNGRSHYGDEAALEAFEKRTGATLELRGGTAPELFERLRAEGEETPADLLVTTDLANLWRADQAGLLEPVTSAALQAQVPDELRDPDGAWWPVSLRVRTPVHSLERVPKGAIETYADLGDARYRGRLCLRTSANEYNQSLVADMIAKRGRAATEALLRTWMENEPHIPGSDVDVLDAIVSGRCDVGLVNHYYLARMLEEDPDTPIDPAWPEQGGDGAHANVSGVGLVKGSEHRAEAIALMEHLTGGEAQALITQNGELPVNPAVQPARHIAEWAHVKLDPIDVERAGRLLPDAVQLMQQVGWK
jgi:iron(III) transport system substrate-binding protein